MLQTLSDRIRHCHDRAAEAREHAGASRDPEAKADFLTMERRWLLLARSIELGERLDDFIRAKPEPMAPRPCEPPSKLQANGAAEFGKKKKAGWWISVTGSIARTLTGGSPPS